jgi:hypothetical protein
MSAQSAVITPPDATITKDLLQKNRSFNVTANCPHWRRWKFAFTKLVPKRQRELRFGNRGVLVG